MWPASGPAYQCFPWQLQLQHDYQEAVSAASWTQQLEKGLRDWTAVP